MKTKINQVLTHSRFSKVHLLLFAVIFGAIGSYMWFHSGAAGFTANIFVSPNGSDMGANCIRFATASSPPTDPTTWCKSMQKAWDLRQPGDIVGVGPGVYPGSQRVSDTADLGGARVQFWPTDSSNPTQFGAEATLAADYQGYPTNSLSFQITDVATLGSPAPTTYMIGQDVFTGCSVSGAKPATVNCTGSNKPRVAGNGTYSYLAGTTVEASTATSFPAPAGFSCAGCKHVEFHDFNYAVLAIGNKEGSVACDPNCHASTDIVFNGGQARIIGGNGGGIDQITYQNMTIGPETAGVTSHYQTFAGQPNIGTITFSHDHWYRQGSSWGCVLSGEASWDGSYCHSECLYINAGTILIDHSLFEGCSQTAIFYQPGTNPGGLRYTSIKMSNSIIGPVHPDAGGTHISVDITYRPNTDLEDFSFVNNSWVEGVLAYNPSNFSTYCTTSGVPDPAKCVVKNWTFRNNAGGVVYNSGGTYCTNTSQISGITYDKDLWAGSVACPGDNPGASSVDALYADYNNLDFHPAASSPLIGAADQSPGKFSLDDYYGTARTAGAVDVGAVQSVKTANLWVSLTGSDSTCARGDPAKPCLTFNKAYQLARAGDTVEVAAGSYPAQTLAGTKTGGACNGTDGGTANACVTFQPASGASVTVAGFMLGADYVNLKGFTNSGSVTINDSACTAGEPRDVIVQNMIGKTFFLDGGTNVTIQGGSFGGVTDSQSSIQACGDYYTGPYSSNVLIEGVAFHDYHWATDGVHMECLHVSSENGLIIRGNSFTNCGIYDLNISKVRLGPITIENNLFDSARGLNDATSGNSSDLGLSPMDKLTVRFNSFVGRWADSDYGNPNDTYTNSNLYGNLELSTIDSFHCGTYAQAGIIVSYNVSSTGGVACGANSIMADNQFTSKTIGAEDFHLAGGSVAARNLVPAAQCPAFDFDNQTRDTADGFCDAGADEYLASYTPPPTAGDTTTPPPPTGGGTPTPPPTSGGATNTTLPTLKKGDCNGDGVVNIYDLSILLSHYNANYASADFDANSVVNVIDLSVLLSNYGK